MSSFKTRLISALVFVAVIAVMYYIYIPPLNIKSVDMWWFFIWCLIVAVLCFCLPPALASGSSFLDELRRSGPGTLFGSYQERRSRKARLNHEPIQVENSAESGKFWRRTKDKRKGAKKPPSLLALFLAAAMCILLLIFVGSIASSAFFNARAYSHLLDVGEGDFATDISEISMSSVPVVDRDTAVRLGSRTIGEISDLVSQFAIDESDAAYTQINYKDAPYRVSPLIYADIVKWITNTASGLPGYVTVNMATQETELVRLPQGSYMHISTGEHFNNYLYRHLRFAYPTEMFGEAAFELDDEGTPYWIVPIKDMTIGLFGGTDYTGAILVNASDGQMQRYDLEQVPNWCDKVFNANLVYSQLNYYGKYQSGFWNSIIGQSGVLVPTGSDAFTPFSSSASGYIADTDGIYNYLAISDDVYMYTGMTSANSDESLVGFVLVNLRTKKTSYYTCAGATESSAMSSAEGQVQQMDYDATSPLLLNIADRPTYFLSLKDDAGLVKMYAFIDVEQYQIVGTGTNIDEAQENYIAALSTSNDVELDEDALAEQQNSDTVGQTSGVLASISPVVLEGNTIYYFMLKEDKNIYTASVSVSATLPFLKAGTTISLAYTQKEGVREVTSIDS